MNKGTQAYRQTQITTIGQGEVLLLLYEGAIKFLTLAKEKIYEKDYTEKGNLISKALDIIAELDAAINAEAGEELAQNLHNLYGLCSTRLLEANLRLDTKLIDTVIDMLAGLRSAFAEIINTPEARAATESIASKMQTKNVSSKHSVNIPKNQQNTGIGRTVAQQAYAQSSIQQPPRNTAPQASTTAPQATQTTGLTQNSHQSSPTAPVAPTHLNPAQTLSTPVQPQTLSSPVQQMPPPITSYTTQTATPVQQAATPVQQITKPAQQTPSPVTTNPEQPIPPASHLPSSFLQRKLTATNLYGKIANS